MGSLKFDKILICCIIICRHLPTRLLTRSLTRLPHFHRDQQMTLEEHVVTDKAKGAASVVTADMNQDGKPPFYHSTILPFYRSTILTFQRSNPVLKARRFRKHRRVQNKLCSCLASTTYVVVATLTSEPNSSGVADIITASKDDNKIRIFKNTQTQCLKQTYVPANSKIYTNQAIRNAHHLARLASLHFAPYFTPQNLTSRSTSRFTSRLGSMRLPMRATPISSIRKRRGRLAEWSPPEARPRTCPSASRKRRGRLFLTSTTAAAPPAQRTKAVASCELLSYHYHCDHMLSY